MRYVFFLQNNLARSKLFSIFAATKQIHTNSNQKEKKRQWQKL